MPDTIRSSYVLGPNDQITIKAFEVDEIGDRPYRVDGDGDVNLPLIGKVHAGGLSVAQFEDELVNKLKNIVRNPRVIVTIVQFRTEPVFFTGAFRAPGSIPCRDNDRLWKW